MSMRTFLAIDLSEGIRAALAETVAELRTQIAGEAKIAWVEPQNLHVTLKFLGEVEDRVLNDVLAEVSRVCADVAPFEFSVRGVACVPPSGNRLRMLWADVADPTGRMEELHTRLDDALSAMGFSRENRGFQAHITLGRVKFARDVAAVRAVAGPLVDEDFGDGQAEQVTAYTSQLTPDGPIYAPLAHACLGG
ncbi:MAG TPA: RNA 2',3'-cyclic phosphodiesterase [Phycisphaerales bacterium]|nr:RNA 2',3'-cyclic phosphodiesterase [Phycisphaerales bacterium]